MSNSNSFPKYPILLSITLLGVSAPLYAEEILIEPSGQHSIEDILTMIGAVSPEQRPGLFSWSDQLGWMYDITYAKPGSLERFGESFALSHDDSVRCRFLSAPAPAMGFDENSCVKPLFASLDANSEFAQIVRITRSSEQIALWFDALTAPPFNQLSAFKGSDGRQVISLDHILDHISEDSDAPYADLRNALSLAYDQVAENHMLSAYAMIESSDDDSEKPSIFALLISTGMFTYADIAALSKAPSLERKEGMIVDLSDVDRYPLLPAAKRALNAIAKLSNNDIQPFTHVLLDCDGPLLTDLPDYEW